MFVLSFFFSFFLTKPYDFQLQYHLISTARYQFWLSLRKRFMNFNFGNGFEILGINCFNLNMPSQNTCSTTSAHQLEDGWFMVMIEGAHS